MKNAIVLGMMLTAGVAVDAAAQTQSSPQPATNGIVSKGKNSTSDPTEGMKRKGSGKMESGPTRNGNSNLSPTGSTNTQGSTSEGSASVPSNGGAKGSNVPSNQERVRPGSSKNNTATDGGLTSSGTPRYGTTPDQNSTSGSTGGSRRPTTTGQVQKEANTSDPKVSTGYPEPTGPGKPGTPSGNAKGKQAGGNSYPTQKSGGSNQ